MKRQALTTICSILMAFTPLAVSAAGGGAALDAANNDLSNTASLQRGAKYYVNYCLGCHSLQYVRYNSLVEDLDLTEDQVMQNLAFTAEKPTEMMTIAMGQDDGERWFGKAPPDLSLTARSRGADWIYTYLRSFYVDESRPFGVNNTVLKGASMPHVLAPLQGYQKAVFETEVDADGTEHTSFKGFEQVSEGSLSEEEYNQVVRDITNFLDYVGEPVQLERKSLGIGVLAFLLIFFLFAYFLKREIWKDVH
ncbi:MAG: cytochrome c1 [Gammaproteobacteria bacterium]|nr:cytochrome c1 [Gammaproteobacteria bacterium]